MTSEYRHVPVLLDEVLDALDPKLGEIMCDCTLGGAGHSVHLARAVAPDGLLMGIDQDDMALEAARKRLDAEAPQATTRLLKGNFGDLDDLLVGAEVPGVDGFLFDLGVSSPQLDFPERGFSYHEDAPLDMRMDPGKQTKTASEIVNHYNEADLARILRTYGDERNARRIARAVVRAREQAPITTTLQLADIVCDAIPQRDRRRHGHPARRSFQAIRIEVNEELDVLERGLRAAIRWLNPGGRLCVIAYHSLEDKIVSHIFHEMSTGCVCPPDLPVCVCGNVPILKVLHRKPIHASSAEVDSNPRARSALMRAAVRLDTTNA